MTRKHLARGVSLVEALVALAVMAFGLLGVAGMQATLRFNADVSKQRSEAVRMAQEQLEDMRAFAVLPVTTGVAAFADIGPIAATAVTSTYANSSFERTVTIGPINSTDPSSLKTATVQVSWRDRRTAASAPAQSVVLSSAIAGISPELGASLGIPGDRSATQRPLGRNRGIPRAAVDQNNGTSTFAPPGGGTLSWTFNNATGLVTSVCNPVGTCTSTSGWLLSGYIRFATGAAPTAAEAENPADASLNLGVAVTQTLPAPGGTVNCFTALSSTYVSYYCLMPVASSGPQTWSGRANLVFPDSIRLEDSWGGDHNDRYKVCRYTTSRTDTPAVANSAHPLDYAAVNGPLDNQNFLLISAGAGGVAFDCPADDAGTPLVNGNTWRHQPAAAS